MKCEVDINLGGLNPIIYNFYGNQVSVVQVINCAIGIVPSITAELFSKFKGTCDESISCDFLTAQVSYEKEFYFFD